MSHALRDFSSPLSNADWNGIGWFRRASVYIGEYEKMHTYRRTQMHACMFAYEFIHTDMHTCSTERRNKQPKQRNKWRKQSVLRYIQPWSFFTKTFLVLNILLRYGYDNLTYTVTTTTTDDDDDDDMNVLFIYVFSTWRQRSIVNSTSLCIR